MLLANFLFAGNDSNEASKPEKEEYDATAVIMHHIKDSHYWTLFELKDKVTGEEHPVAFALPVIVFGNGHLDVFMSSAFNHEKTPVKKGDREYILYHDQIFLANNGALEFNGEHHPVNPKPLDLSITKNVASMMLVSFLLLLIFIPMARQYKKGILVPKGIMGFFEPIVVFIKEDIALPNIGEKKYEKYLPYLLTVFFFIWFNNLIGLIPLFPGGANVTGNIAVTMILAVFTMVITNVSGNKNYWKHIFATPGVPIPLLIIMIPVELISILSKPFALMVRLFANISAGHIIVLSLVSLIFIFKNAYMGFVSVPFVLFMDILELLVALLQAYIFTLLSALFIGLAVQEAHH